MEQRENEFVNMESIRLSALGRDVCVGNIYNYFTDAILPSYINVLPTNVLINKILVPKVERSFFFQQPDNFKCHMLGINSHLHHNITRQSLDFNSLWFAGYLETGSTQDSDLTARVDVIFRIVKRIETLSQQHFEQSNMYEYRLITGGYATHLVEKVAYGVELICSMQRPVDLSCESRAMAEEEIFQAAKIYFDQMIYMDSSTSEMPIELSQITCTIFTSIDAGNVRNSSVHEFWKWFTGVIDSELENRPIEIVLLAIPAQIEALLVSENMNDIGCQKERNSYMWKWIKSESNSISKHPSIDCIPPLEKLMCQFIDLLSPIWNAIENCYTTKQDMSNMKMISDLLTDMKEWLIYRRKEIQITCSLFADRKLLMFDFKEIENRESSIKRARVFILKMDYIQDHLMERMKNFIGKPETSMRPIFNIVNKGKRRLEHLDLILKSFTNLKTMCRDTDYLIGLVPSTSALQEGTIIPVPKVHAPDIPLKVLQNSQDELIKKNQQDLPVFQPNSMLFPPVKARLGPTLYNHHQQFSTAMKHFGGPPENDRPLTPENSCIGKKDPIPTSNSRIQVLEGLRTMELAKKDCKQESGAGIVREIIGRDCWAEKNLIANRPETSVAARIGEFDAKCKEKLVKDEIHLSCEIIETMTVDSPVRKVVNNQRIAEIFADECNQYADLIKQGQPNIYELKAEEILASEDFRWFEVGQPGGSPSSSGLHKHKIIILMGATGCGKSTLINGMINYILGVQWNDPFRFKCVREDEKVATNQAHSQTSTVTAYTLRHQDGMAIPHSITIIDTPGYGDTRGIQRDKEITANIHRFLTRSETRIDEIHAACFVAASGDSRLTATQRYIIDSVLSIFGKDMKDNLRLLVTFADNAVPPVVEACSAAHFPATSASAGITYSKFNSSVLYSCNAKQGEDDFSFDELFWDMGQENFHKFFTMLVGMDGRNLTATREVIQHRQQLEQSLKDIEVELEICLVHIEEMEKFQQQLREYGHNMKTNKDFIVEITEICSVQVPCDEGFVAFNCKTCKRTCEKPSRCKTLKKRNCCNVSCTCPKSVHEMQPFECAFRPMKIKMTLNDMKAQFESNFKRKLTTEDLMASSLEDLNIAKAKVLSLLDQVGANARSLDSTALRSNALSPADYLTLMRSRVLEERTPGYLTRLQTLTELQESLNPSAKKGQSSSSQMATQPVKNTSWGRGKNLQTSSTGTAGMIKTNLDSPGRNGRDETPFRSGQNSHSGGQVITATPTGCGIGNRAQNKMSGINPNGTGAIASAQTTTHQTAGRSMGRGRGQSNPAETAADVIHGNAWKHPPGTVNDYYQACVKTPKKPCPTKGGDCQNPEESADSTVGPSTVVQGKTNNSDGPKIISSFGKSADSENAYSSDDETDQRDKNKKIEKKSEGILSGIYSFMSTFNFKK